MDFEVVIIFQEGGPDDLKVYKLTLDRPDLETLKQCHHQMIGDGLAENLSEWLIGLLKNHTPIYTFQNDGEAAGWPIILTEFSGQIIITGIYHED